MKRKEYAIYTGFKVVWDQFTKYSIAFELKSNIKNVEQLQTSQERL